MSQELPSTGTGRILDDERMEFALGPSLAVDAPMIFTSCAEAAGYPVADAVLAVPGIVEATLSPGNVTVRKARDQSWAELEPALRYAVATAVAGSEGTGSEPRVEPTDDDDLIYEQVSALFRSEINPAVARHGGQIDLIDVQERTVVLRMQGGCQGCGMATVTLRQGIEAQLRRAIPSVAGVRDITDHAGGRNPYFQASTK
jgi:Fe-S cluster biogenesis protein NfuA